jgi:hypothetical protein
MELKAAFHGSSSFYSGSVTSCIMDTGTSLIVMPDTDFKRLSESW